MSDNGAFRKKKTYFTQVSNDALRDKTLSLKAKGLYSLIQSYITMEDFTLYKNNLRKECLEGEKAFESTWKELKDKGYLLQYKLKSKEGHFYYEYDLLEKNQTPKKEGMDNKNQTPKKEVVDKAGVEKAPSRKGGIYKNTKNINTNTTNTNPNNTDLVVDVVANPTEENIITYFEVNICLLKATTKKKYIQAIQTHSNEFIVALIDYCAEINTRSYAGFEVALEAFLKIGADTPEKLKKAVIDYRSGKKRKTNVKRNKNSNDNFNNFEQRDYDFDKLERGLLGWTDKEDHEG
jgi:hypothetical protein